MKVLFFGPGDAIPKKLLDSAYPAYVKSFRASDRLLYNQFAQIPSKDSLRTQYFCCAVGKSSGDFLAGGIFSYFKASKALYCPAFFVNPEKRSGGIGTSFFKRTQAFLLERHPEAKSFMIETKPAFKQVSVHERSYGDNFARAKFWERLGFGRADVVSGMEQGLQRPEYDLRVKAFGLHKPGSLRSVGRLALARMVVDIYRHPDYKISVQTRGSQAVLARSRLSNEGKRKVAEVLARHSFFREIKHPRRRSSALMPPFRRRFDTLKKRFQRPK